MPTLAPVGLEEGMLLPRLLFVFPVDGRAEPFLSRRFQGNRLDVTDVPLNQQPRRIRAETSVERL